MYNNDRDSKKLSMSKLRFTDAKYNTRSFLPRDGVHARDNGMQYLPKK